MLVTDESKIHPFVDAVDMAWIETNEARSNLGDARANAKPMGGNIGRAPGRTLAPPFNAGLRGHTHDCSIEASIFPSTGKAIDATGIRKFDFEDVYLLDTEFRHFQPRRLGGSIRVCR